MTLERTQVAELFGAEIVHGPVHAALALSRTPDPAALVEPAAALADDPAVHMAVRVAALLAIALVAQDGARVPDLALTALEDDLLVDTLIARGASAAITGILAAAAERVSDRLRRYLALRLASSQATGEHVAALQLSLGDLDAGIRSFAPAVRGALRDRPATDAALAILAQLALDWTARHGRPFAVALAERLLPPECDALAAVARSNGAADGDLLVEILDTRAR